MKIEVALGRAFLSLGRTWRLEWLGLEHLEAARRASGAGNVIYAFWHASLSILAHAHRDRNAQVLVSQHRDGEIVARILESIGYGLVRGSTHRGGLAAIFELAKQLERGRDAAITVDGPTGPRYAVHNGVLLLARRTGCPIVPLVATARHCAFLNSWDAQRLALPFSHVRIHHGEPIWVGRDRSAAALSTSHARLVAALRSATIEQEEYFGRRIDLRDVQDRRSYWERVSERPDPPWSLRGVAAVHQALRFTERRLRPRPPGRGGRPWVIGVGNLEAGGTGKTPCVIALVQALCERGLRVAVLTRGHGGRLGQQHPVVYAPSDAATASDETRLLATALPPQAIVVVARRKRRGLALLEARADIDVVVIDDALQTVGLRVDRHLVLLDWENPLGNGLVLPAGRLREAPSALRRAHALVFTRARDPRVPRHPAWSHLEPERTFVAYERLLGLRTPDGRTFDADNLRGQGIALLSGLGRPRAFEKAAEDLATRHGAEVRRIVRVGDHAPIDAQLERLKRKIAPIGCAFIVITRKDACRLHALPTKDEPLLVLEQRLEVDALEELIRVLTPRSSLRPRSPQSSQKATHGPGSPYPT